MISFKKVKKIIHEDVYTPSVIEPAFPPVEMTPITPTSSCASASSAGFVIMKNKSKASELHALITSMLNGMNKLVDECLASPFKQRRERSAE
jgi:hypothetical protein